jgi:hypothetical protein
MKLILLETKCMPILLEKSFKKWITGCGWKWDSIEFKMYGTNAGPSSGAAVPSGLVGLWNLMTSHQSVLRRFQVVGQTVGFDIMGGTAFRRLALKSMIGNLGPWQDCKE